MVRLVKVGGGIPGRGTERRPSGYPTVPVLYVGDRTCFSARRSLRGGTARAMRIALLAAILAVSVVRGAHAQNATVVARTVERDGGEPLGFTAVSVPTQGIERLTNEGGTIVLRDLPPGEIGLRFRRIGFAPTDTVVTVAANDTARIRVEMVRLALQLPAVVVDGRCTDRTPFEEKPTILAELFDQVRQNAERLVLLARERPFTIQWSEERGPRGGGRPTPATQVSSRGPLPDEPYVPGRVHRRVGKVGFVKLPELADIADTAFTNNHCFWYAGQTWFGADSVIQVDFEPVPWLANDVDLEGSVYLRVDGYRLVGMVTRLNRMPRDAPNLVAYGTRARFNELVSGIPILAEVELTNTFRGSREPTVVSTSRATGVRWLEPSKRDTVRPPQRTH